MRLLALHKEPRERLLERPVRMLERPGTLHPAEERLALRPLLRRDLQLLAAVTGGQENEDKGCKGWGDTHPDNIGRSDAAASASG